MKSCSLTVKIWIFTTNFCSYYIHGSQYSPNSSQFCHFFPWESGAIIRPSWGEAMHASLRIQERKNTRHSRFNMFRRYCYEEDFRNSAPRQCDAGVRNHSNSRRSLLMNSPTGAKWKKNNWRAIRAPNNGGKLWTWWRTWSRLCARLAKWTLSSAATCNLLQTLWFQQEDWPLPAGQIMQNTNLEVFDYEYEEKPDEVHAWAGRNGCRYRPYVI